MRGIERTSGDVVGGYRVVRPLGRGGSGAVYLVEDDGGVRSALKLVDTSDAGARARLRREVAALQALRHPAVPRILDAELDDDEAFIVFEYIPGPSLAHAVQERGPMSPDDLVELAEQLSDALAAVHAANVVHRDVTPANVLLGPHGAALIDFGLAHGAEDARLTRAGLVSGTAGYVAPEVIDGAEPSAASDRWSWAATVAFAAIGRAPFGTGNGALGRTLAADIEDAVPPSLARALARDPAVRPDMEDTVDALAERTQVLESAPLAPTRVAPTWESDAATAGGEASAVMPTPVTRELELEAAPTSGELRIPAFARGAFDEVEDDAVMPRRRTVLLASALALVALVTVAPFITAAIIVVLVVIARATESGARAVERSRRRRGSERGGVTAQVLATPWHLSKAIVLALPPVALAAAMAAGVGFAGWALTRDFRDPVVLRAGVLAIAAIAALIVASRGPMAADGRFGAHRVAAVLAPTRGWAFAWVLVGLAVAVACAGVALAGIVPLAWPLPPGTLGP